MNRTLSVVLTLLLAAQLALAQDAPPAAPPRPAAQDPAVAAPKLGRDGKPEPRFIQKHERFVARAKQGNVGLLFLGDSITEAWSGPGKAMWEKHYAPHNAANFGIGGDRTQHVLWRITNGELENISPKVAIIMIGTNNTGSDPADKIAQGVTSIVKTVRQKLPSTKVLLLAVFPRGEHPERSKNIRAKIQDINAVIARLDDGKMVRFLDLSPKFLKEDGTISREIMPDFLHLSPKGYELWADGMKQTLEEMMK
jgi:lysophospholipase L1-like esterase